jgi:hypothetical protein
MTDKKSKAEILEKIATFDSETKAQGFGVLDTMAELARMGTSMSGVSLREWLETQHDNPNLVDMIIERAALLPPLDEPPTIDELREAGKEGKLRVVIETPDAKTMEAVQKHAAKGRPAGKSAAQQIQEPATRRLQTQIRA